jgi:hypothetical protein
MMVEYPVTQGYGQDGLIVPWTIIYGIVPSSQYLMLDYTD